MTDNIFLVTGPLWRPCSPLAPQSGGTNFVGQYCWPIELRNFYCSSDIGLSVCCIPSIIHIGNKWLKLIRCVVILCQVLMFKFSYPE